MSLLDGLSGALTTATNAATAQQQGQLQGNQLAAALQMRQVQLDKERAETKLALRNAAALRLGDPGYAQAEGEVAGTKARAETPALVDRAGGVATAEETARDPFKRAFLEKQDELERGRDRLKAGLTPKFSPFQAVDDTGNPVAVPFNTRTGGFGAPAEGIHPVSGVKMGETMANDFNRQNSKLIDPIVKYASAKNAFAEARAGNPAAAKASLVNFVANADPSMQVRQGVLQYATRIHPGFAGNFEQALGLLINDRSDPKDIDYMERLVDNLHNTNKAMYEQRRNEFVRNRPMADKMIPHADALYDVPGMTPGAAPTGSPSPSTAAGVAAKYGIKPTAP